MQCTWDEALLARASQLPPELAIIIQRHGTNEQYLDAITQAALDPRCTYTIFAHCKRLFAHVSASLRIHGSLASSVATLARILPFAPYLATYATQLLANERCRFNSAADQVEDLIYLLGLYRLLRHDQRTFKQYVELAEIQALLQSNNRPVIYLAIRILQICLDGADYWFEEMVHRYLGADTPDGDINGLWDDKTIDYRFLTLWEEERYAKLSELIERTTRDPSPDVSHARVIPEDCFHPSTSLIGGHLLPCDLTLQTVVPQLGGTVVVTPTIAYNLNQIATALEHTNPILLTGLAGSGKTLLARHTAWKLASLDKMVTLHLNEQSDAKLLIGIYTTGSTPGTFEWKPGVLTTAVQEGRWLLVEDLDRAPTEIIGTLLPLIEKRELLIPDRKQTVHAAHGFRIIATTRTTLNHRGKESQTMTNMLGARHWHHVNVRMPALQEQAEIARNLYPNLLQLMPQLMAVFERLKGLRRQAVLTGQSKTGILRSISPRDLLKWCSRITSLLQQKSTFTSQDVDDIFMEAVDCFVGALPDGAGRREMAAAIAEELHMDPQRRDYLLGDREVRYETEKLKITVGRYTLRRTHRSTKAGVQSTFSTNPHTIRMLERVAAAVVNREPLLLVGETGVGKTTAIQHLATHLGKHLEPFNLSQQSEAGDLLGGFKPVTARSLMVPLKDEFDDLFPASFSTGKNRQFLELLAKQMSRSNWKAVCKLWQQALKMVDQQRPASTSRHGEAPSKKRKVDAKKDLDFVRWDAFAAKVIAIAQRLVAGTEAFAFTFVEGNIVKAVRNGDWVLLDEINLASPDTLESIVDLLDPTSPSLLLSESGKIERVDAHPDFRLFGAMNPATDVGKKDLPPGVRSRFTELYVESPDRDIKSLQRIVRSYLTGEATADQAIALDVSTLYQSIIGLAEQNKLVDGANQKPHFSLRTLTRTLSYAKYTAPHCSLRRALYEGFQMSFLTFLDTESARLVQPLLEQHLFGKRINVRAELQKALRKPSDGQEYVQGYPGSKHWIRQGEHALDDQPHYILTPFIKTNLENLVRATSTRQFPVLIQGPTSSGKTSMIEYLAKRAGHKFVRINNHEHTDLQEYLGTYVSGSDGRLQFQEGILVKALREGHWIVLDELNLAPTDVLEALNRLLDDNRELLIPETQETIRPHQNFMLFATQNPAGLYGGRKVLSRAFRNRFLELHFDDIPVEELQEILHRRTQLPESRCKRIVAVYKELSVLRQENRLFEQKSFATLRDLFRWALRQNDTIEQLAANGFMLLGERVRKEEERHALKEIIEREMSLKGPKVTIGEDLLYAEDCPDIQVYQRNANSQDVVWTKAMRRLYALVSRAIKNDEPVLLVGDTGCGKTTVCQMLAEALGKELHVVNAHQNTETGDLIGSQRPVRNRAAVEGQLRTRLLSSRLLQGMDNGDTLSTDALLSAYDEAVSSLPEDQRPGYLETEIHEDIQTDRTRYKALFEWVDGNLVQAMKEGSCFLLDEISLADDSVLERLNSVLETQRSILLAEKGSIDAFVVAEPGFQIFATMNPGGDYGKRELSPALRNRFTEIWVPALSDFDDIVQIMNAKLSQESRSYAGAMVSFAHWFRQRYNTSAASSVSIRDALAWVQFVNIFEHVGISGALVHGAAMVYIDTLGANPAGLMSLTGRDLEQERSVCLAELGRLIGLDAAAVYSTQAEVRTTGGKFQIGPFSAPRKQVDVTPSTFNFEAPTTRINAMRVLRAMQLPKSVMLEGSPGVGKTALVTAIAQAVGIPLTRINLSEQTDLLDLFGSDAPVEGAVAGTFAWRDAPFLRAMKNGEWVLLDEMNLASQSVLEGLNACLDHRGEIFVPELGQTFIRHPEFRLFAAQNPHHQGGGRKGLPASFVNRFTVVYADAFQPDDLLLICKRSFPTVEISVVEQVVHSVTNLDVEVTQRRRFGTLGGPWEFNLRDISRWLILAQSENGLVRAGNPRDFVNIIFSQRFRSGADRAAVEECFCSVFNDTPPASDLFCSISPQTLQLGLATLPRNLSYGSADGPRESLTRSSEHLQALQSLMLCVQQRWPVIVAGSAGAGKTLVVNDLASMVGASVETISLNAETDAMDLIGGYEQSDPLRQRLRLLDQLQQAIVSSARAGLLEKLDGQRLRLLSSISIGTKGQVPDTSQLAGVANSFQGSLSLQARQLLQRLQDGPVDVHKANFEWVDGLLVDALRQGKWLVLDNANLCSSSVLDRLNSLLEPNGTLIINEHTETDGTPRIVAPHPDFRIFLTVDPRFGELSRAMRNRAVELYLHGEETTPLVTDPLSSESAIARFRQIKVMGSTIANDLPAEHLMSIVQDHMSLRDQSLLSRLDAQLGFGLYDCTAGGSLQEHASVSLALRPSLKSFYHTASSRADMSADFACAQTFHPLNNQTLVQRNTISSSQAAVLGFVYDVNVRLDTLHKELGSIESNTGFVQQLQRAERSSRFRSRSHKQEPGVLAAVDGILQTTLQWTQQLEVQKLVHPDIPRSAVYRLCALWSCVLQLIRSSQFDFTLLDVWMSTALDIVSATFTEANGQLSGLLSTIKNSLASFASDTRGLAGRGCAPLWEALRPALPKSLAQLDATMQLEGVVARFDTACQHFPLALQDLAKLRSSFARTLGLRDTDPADLSQLSEHIESLIPQTEEMLFEDTTVTFPHFRSVFEGMCQHYALLELSSLSPENGEIAALRILAGRATVDGIDAHLSLPNLPRNLYLLPQVLPQRETDNEVVSLGQWSTNLVDGLISVDNVSLRQLDLVETECQILGESFGRDAHNMCRNEMDHLDECLRQLSTGVLEALSVSSNEPQLVALTSPLLEMLGATTCSTHGGIEYGEVIRENSISKQLHTAVAYLANVPLNETARSERAAEAWTAFALACLTLYVGDQPWDPLMKPQLEQNAHRRSHDDLHQQQRALRQLAKASYGTSDSLRIRVLQEDIDNLGSEPVLAAVCRPPKSSLTQLYGEFSGLLRAVEPLQRCYLTGEGFIHDRLLTTNLERIRGRLTHQYRVYSDMTKPVVGFIDCLRVGNRLALRASPNRSQMPSPWNVAAITPLVNASLETWYSDEAFIDIVSHHSAPREMMYGLAALATRSLVHGLDKASNELQHAVGESFSRLFQEWKTKLSQDQRQNAANNSLYRYQGDSDLQDEATEEDILELFPTGEANVVAQTDDTPLSQTQELADEIAQLHCALYSSDQKSEEAITTLLSQFLSLSGKQTSGIESKLLLPSIFYHLQDTANTFRSIGNASKAYNIYTDTNVPEAKKLSRTLHRLKKRFSAIKAAWPEHATPVEVFRICDQMFSMKYSAPLVKFLPVLESLHATVTEWQKVASREFSVQDMLEELTGTIVSWRQLELSSWAGLLDRETANCDKDARSWWFIAYENIVAAPAVLQGSPEDLQRHADGLLKTLEGFLANSGFGEYSSRLNILRTFVAQLSVPSNESEFWNPIIAALTSFVEYYQRFEAPVAERLVKGRMDLERDIKNVIQVASWKDRNVEILRQSAKSSHKKLLRLVRKYRKVLAQPAASIISGDIPDEQQDHKIVPSNVDAIAPPVRTYGEEPTQMVVHHLPSWDNRPDRFRNVEATVGLMSGMAKRALKSIDGPARISTFAAGLISAMSELRKANPAILTEENKSVVQHIKSRKRRLLADTLKDVRLMGFQISLSEDILSQQSAMHIVLARSASLRELHRVIDTQDVDLHFHRLLSIMPTVRESARKHSEDLTPAEASRCLGLLESMLHTAVLQRATIHAHIQSSIGLQQQIDQLNGLSSSVGLAADRGEAKEQEKETMSIGCLSMLIPVCLQILQAQISMSGKLEPTALKQLTEIASQLVDLKEQVAKRAILPTGILHDREKDVQSQYHDLVQSLRAQVETVCATRPELEPVLSQLLLWIHRPAQSSATALTNRHVVTEPDAWASHLINTLDDLLASMQSLTLEKPVPSDDKAWLRHQQQSINSKINNLRVTRVSQSLADLFTRLRQLAKDHETILPSLGTIVRSIQPITATYSATITEALNTLCALHMETTKMAYQLAATFVQLAQQGFCTPPEKPAKDEQSNGNVESGTGLGDGEGAEDISKDVGDDEDLSELAQQANENPQKDDIEDEKDAVDMADEEMEGALEQQDEANADDDGASEGSDRDDDADIDEEAGDVDDLGPSAVDEKMWDEGDKSEQAEKEGDNGADCNKEQDLAAAENDASGRDQEQDEKGLDEAQPPADESENVESHETERMDQNVDEEQNLDLPDDINMENKETTEEDDSDLDDMPNDDAEAMQLPDALIDDESTDETEEHDGKDVEQDKIDDDIADGEREQDGENESTKADDNDAASDILMQEAHEEANPKPDDAMFGESGNGADEDQNQAPKPELAAVEEPQPEGPESDKKQQQPETGETGAQSGQQSHEATSGAEDAADHQATLPFKQIGDALDEWYKKQRDIEAAKEDQSKSDGRQHDSDMANARFEHLPDDSAEAETQALGAASAEQSTALDEESGKPVSEDIDSSPPFQEDALDKTTDPTDESHVNDPSRPEPSENVAKDRSKAFVGESSAADPDYPMEDNCSDTSDNVDDVDQQLINTHITPDDLPAGLSIEEARSLWSEHEARTRNLALVLTEHLRLILQPTQATKMRGDFRTGKRLNIKRIIPYIASSYKRDKIWMRRSIPSKRSYQIMLAIDDSSSMAESDSRDLAFETLALVAKSMSLLEVGQLAVVGFGEEVNVAHDFSTPFTSEAGAEVFKQFSFAQSKTNVRKMLAESIELFRDARLKASGSSSELWQLQLIISDGVCEDHPTIRQLVRQAREERIMIVFIVVDAAAEKAQATGGPEQSILDLRTAEFTKDSEGEMQLKMVKYLDTFPFSHYLIVRDVQELPAVLAGALRQWFAEVVETGG